MQNMVLVTALARSFLAGEATAEELAARGGRTLGRKWLWLRPLARRYVNAFAGQRHPRLREAVKFLEEDNGFERARRKYSRELRVVQWLTGPQRMQPVATARAWRVPAIESVGLLAEWLRLTPGELQWFADLKGISYNSGNPLLGHYHYRLLSKRFGAVRLIEAPKPRLKRIQQQILTQILDRIPAHLATHGFVKGRSIRTFAEPHQGKQVVLRMDLCDFFPTFPAARIQSVHGRSDTKILQPNPAVVRW